MQVRVEALLGPIPAEGWQRIDVGAGSKGPRVYDWACGRLPYLTARRLGAVAADPPLGQRPGGAGLLPRLRPRRTTRRRAGAGGGDALGDRGGVPAGQGGVGLDQYEVRRWEGWYRHITLCLLAHAFLAVTRARQRRKRGEMRSLIPLTVPEVRRLLAVLLLSREQRANIGLHWSRWRRQRQAEARRSHYKRRLARSFTKCRCSIRGCLKRV